MSESTLLVSRSPQTPTDVVVEIDAADAVRVSQCATAARRAGREWATQPAAMRVTALLNAANAVIRRASEFEDLLVREIGKPRIEARGEVARAISILHYYAQQILDPIGESYSPSVGGLLYTDRRPLGVAGLITPWNFPIAIPLWKAAPALAAGNAVLMKPSTDAIGCAQLLAQVLGEALPPDVFTVIPGRHPAASAIIENADVVSFTGSTAVGRQVVIAAATRGIPVQAEMGGQNAALVMPDADLEHTAAMLVGAAMSFAGQKCTATRRIIVVGDPAPLTEALRAALDDAVPGDPAEENVTVGPVINQRAQSGVNDAIAEAQGCGARIIASNASVNHDGWFVRPTFVDGLAPGHRLLQEETFGPFAAILPARTFEEAVDLANNVKYGLVNSIHGRDLSAILRMVEDLESGVVKVNAPTTGVDFYLPFGGEKDSSIGPREQGKAAMQFYSSSRTVTIAGGPSSRPDRS
jgi:acyl-CoA reductase-like NAD-dependent aldehyde dehydrogenase